MSCKCNDNDEGCAPLPVVSKGSRALVRGPDGCPAELSGAGVVTQTSTGVSAATGSATSPVCFGDIQQGTSLDALVGVSISDIGGVTNCVVKLLGGEADAGKVVKWSGTAFELRSLLETLCYDSSVVQDTCCPDSLAVWGQSGSSLCLQKWDPCSQDGKRNVVNPSFVVCEGGRISPLQLCDLPTLTEGTSYQQIVCTEDGPRVLGGSGVSAKLYIPFDVLGSGNAVLLPDSTRYDEGDGTNISGTFDIAALTGVAVPAGTTHIRLSWSVVLENNNNNSLFMRGYVPGSVSNNNQRLYMNIGDTSSDDDSSGFSCDVPLSSGTVSWLFVKSGSSTTWDTSLFCRVDGYWVG